MMRYLKKLYPVFIGLLVLVASVGGVLAVSGIDFIDGLKIPTTLTADRTHSGVNTFSGGLLATGGAVITGQELSYVSTNSTTYAVLSTDDVVNVASGTAATLTLPATLNAGKVYTVLHNNGTVATTITALGGYSINGAVSNTALDAATDMAVIVGTSTGWVGGFSNH